MRIGIDIDDTLVNTSESFEKFKKKYNINFYKKWNDDWTKEELDFIFDKYLGEILLGAEIKKNAIEVINYLHSLGHKMVVITARSNKYCKNLKEKTIEFIQKENLQISEIYFDQNGKSDLAKQLKIDLMIDDNIDVYNNMKRDKIDCILFGDKIKTWEEVLEYVLKKEE